MSSPQERRRFPRYDVSHLPGVIDGFRLFDTLKLGAGGALVVLSAELGLEQRVHVSLEIGEAVFRSAAYVVFVGPDLSSPGLFRVGLAFTDTDGEDRERLLRFIERALASGDIR